jgi:uncharacterized protein with ParB-like and HNH nuclease domain
MLKFDPQRRTIEDLFFEPRFIYEIPKYQRPYSWKKEQLEEFWKLIINNESTFIGTVIYNIKDFAKKSKKEVIDGQQRYLTISILAAALRDSLLEFSKEKSLDAGKERARDIHEELIGRRDRATKKYKNFLITGASAKEYFQSNIQSLDEDFFDNPDDEINLTLPITQEEKLISTTYYYFKSLVKELIIKNDIEKAYTILRSGLSKLFVISIEIDDYEIAFEIFESVNSQGVDLSVADLIKNQIFKNINSNDYLKAEEKWAEIIENLENTKVNLSPKEFLRYHWASKFEYVGDSKLYKAIKTEYSKEGKNWSCFLKDLHEDSKIILQIINYSKDQWQQDLGKDNGSKAFNSINVLRNLKAKTWIVLVLSMTRNLPKIRKHGLSYAKNLEKIQLFTFFYFGIMGFAGNWYWMQMYKSAQKIYRADSKQEFLKVFEELYKNFALKSTVTKTAFNEGFNQITFKQYGLAKYILSNIELKLRGEASSGWDNDLVNIEHFLPQEPREWKLKKTEIKQHINLLGNLVLISSKLNSSLGNSELSNKLKLIENSGTEMKMLNDLLEKNKNKIWNFSLIENKDFSPIELRQEYLSDKGYSIWVTEMKSKLGY